MHALHVLHLVCDAIVYPCIGAYLGVHSFKRYEQWRRRKKGIGYKHFREHAEKFVIENGQLVKKEE